MGVTQREALEFIDRIGTLMCDEIRSYIDVNRTRSGQGNWLLLTKMKIFFKADTPHEARWTTVLAIRQILDEQQGLRLNDTKPLCQLGVNDDRTAIRTHVARFFAAARERGLCASRIKPRYSNSGEQTIVEMYIISESSNGRPQLLAKLAQGERKIVDSALTELSTSVTSRMILVEIP